MNQHQLTMTAGDTRTFDFSDIVDADGNAFNLAGATVRFIVENSLDKVCTLDESSGSIEVTLSKSDTDDLSLSHHRHYGWSGRRRYAVRVTLADDSVVTARRGLFVVTPAVEDV